MTGIYGIYNWKNGKWYVGQSVNINRRKSQERSNMKTGRLHCDRRNRQIETDWQIYGPDAFVWVTLEECSKDELNDRESYWIDEKDSYINGYNLTTGGNGRRSRPGKQGGQHENNRKD